MANLLTYRAARSEFYCIDYQQVTDLRQSILNKFVKCIDIMINIAM